MPCMCNASDAQSCCHSCAAMNTCTARTYPHTRNARFKHVVGLQRACDAQWPCTCTLRSWTDLENVIWPLKLPPLGCVSTKMKRARLSRAPKHNTLRTLASQQLEAAMHPADCRCRDYLPWIQSHETIANPNYYEEHTFTRECNHNYVLDIGGCEVCYSARSHWRFSVESYLVVRRCIDNLLAMQLYLSFRYQLGDRNLAILIAIGWLRSTRDNREVLRNALLSYWMIRYKKVG